jgi:hypothetical protein
MEMLIANVLGAFCLGGGYGKSACSQCGIASTFHRLLIGTPAILGSVGD